MRRFPSAALICVAVPSLLAGSACIPSSEYETRRFGDAVSPEAETAASDGAGEANGDADARDVSSADDTGDASADASADGDASEASTAGEVSTAGDVSADADVDVPSCRCAPGLVCDDSGACVDHVCGNGALEADETCDPPESCPASCDDAQACTEDALVGDASQCSVRCEHAPVLSCQAGDGCCADGCSVVTDIDCSATCGDGTVQAPETCDPPATCPTQCDDGDACTADLRLGSSAACSAECWHDPIGACTDGDACCPAGCNALADSDCEPVCANGVVEPPETCDPPASCSTSCDDGNACTADAHSGRASECTLACTHAAIASCRNGDGCCPPGCTARTDADCDAVCGNSVVEPGETCDPPSSCPSCNDGNACTTDARSGDPLRCDVVCATFKVTACVGEHGQPGQDGCCPTGCNALNDSDCAPKCGNAVLEAGEICDPASTCPTSCSDGDACTTDTATGSSATCSRVCQHTLKTQCSSGDGCCPAGCNRTLDNDCPSVCGNLVVESGETCDPPSSCPSCSDANACTTDASTGSSASCTLRCTHQAVTQCRAAADGCCAPGCSELNDPDCDATCGDGVVEPGETCDPPGSCPSSCNDGNACTSDALVGSRAACTAACRFTAITSCASGDACCPQGCGAGDSDCVMPAVCGDGVVDAGETCDPTATCPKSCNDSNVCTKDTLLGDWTKCTSQCKHDPLACGPPDGCCPSSACSVSQDPDCPAVCGNGVVESGETCDPPGSCPTSCNDGLPCTQDTLSGSAAACTSACTSTPISACTGPDGCCPGSCGAANDADCASDCGGVCVSDDGCCPAGCDLLSDDDCVLDCTDDATWPAAWRSFEDQVVALTNQRRAAGATCGATPYPPVPALAFDPLLRIAARCHSLDMGVTDSFGHVGSDGSLTDERVDETGYNWQFVGENISAGHPTPADVVAGWMSSGGHCTNIMKASFTEVGVGYAFWPGSTWTHYWTQVFATPF